ncbi:glycoside hydrolase superfamily [Apiospora arundinis]
MGGSGPAYGAMGNMSAAKKRSIDTFLQDVEQDYHDAPSKRPYCPESLSSRVTDWLSQLPPESALEDEVELDGETGDEAEVDPDTMHLPKKDKGKSKGKTGGSATGGLATPSLASASGASRPPTAIGSYQESTSTGRLVERGDYRVVNLKQNGIHILTLEDEQPIPANVSAACNTIGKPRTSPEPTPDEARRQRRYLTSLQTHGASEGEVEDWLKRNVFPGADDVCESGLIVRPKPTFQNCIPSLTTPNKIPKPIPDLVYGYTTKAEYTKFSDSQLIAGQTMDPPMGKVVGTGDLSFPFFVIEFKGVGPSNGNPWVASNQCAGGSAACVETAERLNRLLQQYPAAKTLDNISFSIGMDQDIARLFVSWSSRDLEYYLRDARPVFDLRSTEQYLLFRRYVKNILDWGKGPRLQEIQDAFDFILEEERKKASDQARQRPAPSASGSDSGKRAYLAQSGNSASGGSSVKGGGPTKGSVAPGRSSSRTQSNRSDRPPQVGYRSTSAASAASGSKSYQSGSYPAPRSDSGLGPADGQDRRSRPPPPPPESRSGSTPSRSSNDTGRQAPIPPRPSGSGSYASGGSRSGSAGGQDMSSRPPPPQTGGRPGSTPSRSSHDDGRHAPRHRGPAILDPKQQPKPRNRSGGYDDGQRVPPPTRSSGSSAPRLDNSGQKPNATSRDPNYRGDSSFRNQFPDDYDRR